MAGPSYSPGPGFGAYVNQLANPPNPMQQLQQTVGGLNALKSYQANQASADAYRQSVDPTTGEVDLGKYKALMSQGPGAWLFGPQTQQAGQAVGAVGTGTTADVQSKVAQLGAASQFMYPLVQRVNNGGTVSPQEAQASLDQAHGLGLVNDQVYGHVAQQIAQIPQGGNANSIVLGAAMGNEAEMHTLAGNVAAINTGPQTVFKQTTGLGGQPPASSTTQMGLSPEGALKLQSWLAEPATYTDKQGRIHNYTSRTQFYNELGINPFKIFTDGTIPAPGAPLTVPEASAPTTPGTAGPVSTVTTGRVPVPTAGPTPPTGAPAPGSPAPAAPAAPAVPTAGPTPAPVATPPASSIESPTSPSAALPPDIVAKGQKDYATAQTNQQNLPTQLQPLRSAMGLLKTNQDLQTGPGQAQFAQAVTGIAAALNIKVPAGSTDLQELTKALVQNVRAQETGGSTDLDRLQTEAANPNPTTQSREALQVLLAKQIGATRLQAGALDYFNSKYPDAQTAATNSGRFNIDTTDWKKKQDPTAWAIDELLPEQVGRYFNGLSGDYDKKTGVATGDKATFIHSLRDARTIGGLGGGAPPPLPAGAP